jgi:Zn-dependent protease with chaperone function
MGLFSAAIFLTWGLNNLMLISWRRSIGTHWTERARLLYPARTAAKMNIFLIPAIITLRQQDFLLKTQIHWSVTAIFAWAGVILGTYPFDREVFPQLTSYRVWLRLVVASWLLQFSVWIVFLVAFILMPEQFCRQTMLLGGGALVFYIWLNLGLLTALARFFRLLEKPSASLFLVQIVSKLSTQMAKPIRTLWLLNSPFSYAAALPMTGDLIFSKRLIELHPEPEIAAICAHEIAHLTESRIVKVGRLAGSLMFFPWLFFKPVANKFDFAGLVGLAVVSVLLLVFALRIARRMEVRADAVARDNQSDGGTYARALERLYEANQTPAVMLGNRQAHPHLYDRMLAAGVTPSYERPKPPQRIAWTSMLLSVALGLQLGMMLRPPQSTSFNNQDLKKQDASTFYSELFESTLKNIRAATNNSYTYTNSPLR